MLRFSAVLYCLPLAILAWQWALYWQQPVQYVPQEVQFRLAPGEERTLGRDELAAPQADEQHWRVRRDAAGAWWGSNLSTNKALLARISGANEFANAERGIALQQGMQLTLANQRLQVLQANRDGLAIQTENGKQWRFDGRNLRPAVATSLPVCPAQNMAERWRHLLSRIFSTSHALQIGGSLTCSQRLPWSTLLPASASIVRRGDEFVLIATNAAVRSQLCANLVPCLQKDSLQAQEFALAPQGEILLGRSMLQWRLAGDHMYLMPLRRVALANSKPAVGESIAPSSSLDSLQTQWQVFSPWQAPFHLTPRQVVVALACVALAGLVTCALWYAGASRARRARPSALQRRTATLALARWTLVGAVGGLFLLALLGYVYARNTQQLGYAWFLVLYSLSLVCAYACIALANALESSGHPGTLGNGFAIALSLLTFGVANQQALGMLALDSGGMRFFISTAALASGALSCFGGALLWRALLLNHRQRELGLLIFAGLALAAMLLEVLFGDEAGLGAWQPIELAKCALILLAAHLLALRSAHIRSAQIRADQKTAIGKNLEKGHALSSLPLLERGGGRTKTKSFWAFITSVGNGNANRLQSPPLPRGGCRERCVGWATCLPTAVNRAVSTVICTFRTVQHTELHQNEVSFTAFQIRGQQVAHPTVNDLPFATLPRGERGRTYQTQPLSIIQVWLARMRGAHPFSALSPVRNRPMRLLWIFHAGLESWRAWWPYLQPLSLFVLILFLCLLSVRDFSPLLLLAAWVWGMALAWALLHRRYSMLALTLALLALMLFCLRQLYLGEIPPQWQLSLWSERLAVWRAPQLHPYSGMQFLRAFALMQQSQFDPTALAGAWLVPEIQNDFSPSFFVARFGKLGVLLLLFLQLGYLAQIWRMASHCWQQGQGGDYRQRLRLHGYTYALIGFSVVLAAHFAMSWCCNLGWLPVMGQPMPFLSAAGSNLLLFLLPLLILQCRVAKLAATEKFSENSQARLGAHAIFAA